MPVFRRLSTTVCVAAVALILSACSSEGAGETVNVDAIQTAIAEQLEQQLGDTPVNIDCPDEITAQQGETVACTFTDSAGETRSASVTFTDDQGNVDITVE